MAPESNNWLSFSLSSMEMFSSSPQAPFETSSAAATTSHHLYPFGAANNFYANGWYNQKSEAMYDQLEDDNNNSFNFTSYMDPYMHQHHQNMQQPPPKLEDFFGGDSTETQDSSLTHLYDHGSTGNAAYLSNNDEQQDLKAITGFQSFPANSGSEVDDSALATQSSPVESGRSELAANYSQAQCPVTAANALSLGVNNNNAQTCSQNNNNRAAIVSENCKRVSDTFGQRTSIYRGVTRHRWTGRYEAHLWDNSCRREGQARKGRQVYLGGYDKEDKAARAYDLAALKYWGLNATTNFPIANYAKEMEEMKHVTKQEFIASLRRKSSGFSRGASIYRGVTRHHQQGRWQARIGRVAGNKDLYLGTFATEEEAAEAYDIAAIKFRGGNAVTNFEMSRYDVETIANSPLPVGGTSKRLKLSDEKPPTNANYLQLPSSSSNSINFASFQPPASTIPCGIPFDINFFHHLHAANAGVTSAAPTMVTLMPSDFFIWPHQSY